MRRRQTAGEVMQFLQAANGMRASLPRMVQVLERLRTMLEERMSGAPRRTTKFTRKLEFLDRARTHGCVRAWRAAQEIVAHDVTQCHPRPDLDVLMFTDASDAQYGSLFNPPDPSVIVAFRLKTRPIDQ